METFDEYELLNDALNAVIFDGRFAMRPVYVDLEDSLALEVSAALGIAPAELDDFIALAVAETLFGPQYDPYHWHAPPLKPWTKTGRTTPQPFTCLSLASTSA